MPSSKEYNLTNTNYNGSDYKTLNMYNTRMPGTVFIGNYKDIWSVSPEYSMDSESVAKYNLPMNYNALTHNLRPDQMNSNQHFTVQHAYPAYSQRCRTNQSRKCDGGVGQ